MFVMLILCVFLSNFKGINQENDGFKPNKLKDPDYLETNINFDVDFKVIEKRSEFLEKLFALKDRNGDFEVTLNSTDLLVLRLDICQNQHKLQGTIKLRKGLCGRNPKSYSISCYKTRKTNFEPECSFTFCLDKDHFGQGQVSCD